MKNCLAIIPARGGSKRIPKKNIKPFLNIPVINYSIEAAKKTKIFDEIMVSTDDNEICKIAITAGAKVPFLRSKKNSGDKSTLTEVIKEVLKYYLLKGMKFKYFACIYPVAPLIDPKMLQESLKMLMRRNVDAVIPVIAYSHPIQRALKMNRSGKLLMINGKYKDVVTQDIPVRYHDSGQFFLMRTSSFNKKGMIFTDNVLGIKISERLAQDIDNEDDWYLAEMKYSFLHRQV
jgi:pseudaminic acid cytidylyltransferase